jgi:hypothetical protein
MSITTSLKTAINTAIQADSTITSATSYRGYGMTPPVPLSGDALTWFLVTDTNDDFMRANTDYYKSVDVQFSAWTANESPLTASAVRDAVEALFRFTPLTMATGRNLSTDIGQGLELEDPEGDGWQSTITLTFQIGT